MSTLGWQPIGDPVTRLCDAIDECEALWGNDPAYRDILFNLDKVEQELDNVVASPGRRAALRAAKANIGGQDPVDRGEPPSTVEKGYQVGEYSAIAGKFAEVQKGLTNRFAGEKESTGQLVESSGATTLKTPKANEYLTLYWIWLFSSQENTGEVTATVKLGSKTVYVSYLGNPGAFAHWEPVKGEVGDKLILELSGAQKVAVSFTYSELVPQEATEKMIGYVKHYRGDE